MLEWLTFWRPPCLLRAVIVTMTGDGDTAIEGILWRSRGPWLVLREASLVQARGPALKVDGEIVMHRERVAFLQVLPR